MCFGKREEFIVGLCLNLDVSSFEETYAEAKMILQEAIELNLEDTNLGEFRFNRITNPRLVKSEITLSHAQASFE